MTDTNAKFFEVTCIGQQNLQRMTRQYESFVRSMIDVIGQQIELSREMIEDGIEDFAALTQARTPDALIRAEIEMFRKRSERVVTAATRMGGVLQTAFTEAMTAAEPDSRRLS